MPETVQDSGKLILLFRDRYSHTGFPLVPKWVTLNDIEQRSGRQFALFSPNSVTSGAINVTVVKVRLMLSATKL